MEILKQTVVVVPALNEGEAVGFLIREIKDLFPDLEVVVVNDCSIDDTNIVAINAGAIVIDLPCNLGVAGAVQAGLRYALDRGFQYAIRCDGDGQHPPSEIPKLLRAMERGTTDLVVGVREAHSQNSISLVRSLGIKYLSILLSYICKTRVTDPTSGFHLFNRLLMYYFSRQYPADYPEPESLALLRRQGYKFQEVPVTFKPRIHGKSSLNSWGSLYYAFKVTLALIVDRARTVDTVYARHNLVKKISPP